MDPRRVGRLARTLIVSQLRSGQGRTSDARAWTANARIFAYTDALLFVAAVAVVAFVLAAGSFSHAVLVTVVGEFAPFVPLLAVASVLIAGLMFGLTASVRFARSDAANWLPISPAEYVGASASAIACTYSPVLALVLGALLPLAVAAGMAGAYVATVALGALSLLEGAVLVEMIRATVQTGRVGGRIGRGRVALVLRAAVLVVVFTAFELALNPLVVLGFLDRFSSVGYLTAAVPFFWSTESLIQWTGGRTGVGALLALGQVVLVGGLYWLATVLRRRFWNVTPVEAEVGASRVAPGHPWLRTLGLGPSEAALAAKDLKGLVRRRELLTLLVLPIILVVVLLASGQSIRGLGAIVYLGYDAGLFALILSSSSIGHEGRSIAGLYAYPITSRQILRAKAAATLVPGLVGALGMAAVVGVVYRLSAAGVLLLLPLIAVVTIVEIVWGLAFAARYSDFEERPRPQFVRPTGILLAILVGSAVMVLVLIPGGLAVNSPGPGSWAAILGAAAAATGAGLLGWTWARTGFDRLFRQIPF